MGGGEANKEHQTQSKILKFYWYSNFQPFLPSFLPWHAKVEKSGNFETLKASIWFKRFGRKRCFILDRTSFHFFVTDDSHLIWGKREKGVPRGKQKVIARNWCLSRKEEKNKSHRMAVHIKFRFINTNWGCLFYLDLETLLDMALD